jgi:hypothetical protein
VAADVVRDELDHEPDERHGYASKRRRSITCAVDTTAESRDPAIMSIVADELHVRLAGDRVGRYVVADERPDGTLVLRREDSADAMLDRRGLEPASVEELEAEHGPIGPADGEG